MTSNTIIELVRTFLPYLITLLSYKVQNTCFSDSFKTSLTYYPIYIPKICVQTSTNLKAFTKPFKRVMFVGIHAAPINTVTSKLLIGPEIRKPYNVKWAFVMHGLTITKVLTDPLKFWLKDLGASTTSSQIYEFQCHWLNLTTAKRAEVRLKNLILISDFIAGGNFFLRDLWGLWALSWGTFICKSNQIEAGAIWSPGHTKLDQPLLLFQFIKYFSSSFSS